MELDISNELRQNLIRSLPGLDEIQNPSLRDQVIGAAGCHSREGELVQRLRHVTIVHHAD